MRRTAVLGLACLGLGIGAAACGGGSSDTPDAEEAENCVGDPRAETFTAGLEKTGASGMIDFKLMSSDPAPPQHGNNTWVIQVNSMSSGAVGNPISGATITVTTYMPDHNHYGVKTNVTDNGDGTYTLKPVNTFMPGYWEITVKATSGSTTDQAVYKFCIAT